MNLLRDGLIDQWDADLRQTCIALRTMLVKDSIAYLQAGVGSPHLGFESIAYQPRQGGIVFDSDPYDEWVETINKLGE